MKNVDYLEALLRARACVRDVDYRALVEAPAPAKPPGPRQPAAPPSD